MGKKSPSKLDQCIAKWICRCLGGVDALSRFRDENKFGFGWLPGTVLSFLVGTAFFWVISGHPISGEEWTSRKASTLPLWGKGISAVVTGFLVNVVFLKGLGLVAAIASHAPAIKELGLVEAYVPTANEKYSEVVEKYRLLDKGNDPVRVICMAGRWVFRNHGTPLHDHALAGRLHVVMPRPDVEGLSFKVRHESAPPDQAAENTPEVMVASTKSSFSFLAGSSCKVYFHDQICIWRAVLFQDYCVVQAYLPNRGEKGHMGEPILVFSKEGSDSLYHTFSAMFDAMKKHNQQAH
jgi:hypothetical protein